VSQPWLHLFAMNQRGLAALEAIVRELDPHAIAAVVGARDAHVRDDFYDDIRAITQRHGIRFLDRSEAAALSPSPSSYMLAVGWRWMIHGGTQLIVFHDSLLPRYRGFSPLPTALINGDREIGVTALFASDEYDRGDVIAQKGLCIEYPIKIQKAIELVTRLYAELVVEIARAIVAGVPLTASPQDETQASYSPWRGEDDYRIEWSHDAATIKRFIDAVGFPYKGASSELDGALVRILDASIEPDVRIEQRMPGRVMFIRDQMPVVACGTGMLRLLDVRDNAARISILPLRKFRSRFR
jgi:methionyl-tRNA formyltransferase